MWVVEVRSMSGRSRRCGWWMMSSSQSRRCVNGRRRRCVRCKVDVVEFEVVAVEVVVDGVDVVVVVVEVVDVGMVDDDVIVEVTDEVVELMSSKLMSSNLVSWSSELLSM